MNKKSQVKIPQDPPENLSEKASELWRQVVPRRCRSPERIAMLTVALECLDRADEANKIIDCEGLTTTTERSGLAHVHPLLKAEKESRQLFARMWAQLGLNFDGTLDGFFHSSE